MSDFSSNRRKKQKKKSSHIASGTYTHTYHTFNNKKNAKTIVRFQCQIYELWA